VSELWYWPWWLLSVAVVVGFVGGMWVTWGSKVAAVRRLTDELDEKTEECESLYDELACVDDETPLSLLEHRYVEAINKGNAYDIKVWQELVLRECARYD
jgi:hypothetical protein